MLGSYNLQHPIDKAGSTPSTLFSSEDAFPMVSLLAEKLKLFINLSDGTGMKKCWCDRINVDSFSDAWLPIEPTCSVSWKNRIYNFNW